MLQQHLAGLASLPPSIVLKIETRRGFDNLPEMLLQAMKSPSCGVMIARGDLAVECGFERLAEVQEEILWICEAAHVPVYLGHSGPGDSGQRRDAIACGDYGCSHGRPSGMCDAQQRSPHCHSRASSGRHTAADAIAPKQKAFDAPRVAAGSPDSRRI